MSNTDRVASSPERVHPSFVGTKIPEVSVRTADGTPFDLAAAIKTKPTVLVFYRGGW